MCYTAIDDQYNAQCRNEDKDRGPQAALPGKLWEHECEKRGRAVGLTGVLSICVGGQPFKVELGGLATGVRCPVTSGHLCFPVYCTVGNTDLPVLGGDRASGLAPG